MRIITMHTLQLALCLFAAGILAACIDTTQPLVLNESSSEASHELGQPVQLSGTDILLDFPSDWIAKQCGTVTAVGEIEEDVTTVCRENAPVAGLLFVFDHRDIAFMQRLGLPADPSLNDLVDLNESLFLLDVTDRTETTFMDVPAIRYRSDSQLGPWIEVAGFLDDEVFLLTLGAPDEETREAAEPLLVQILASARRVE